MNKRYLSHWFLVTVSLAVLVLILLANPLQPQARPMTTGTAAVTPTPQPTLSADAQNLTGNIVYVSNRSGNYELYLTPAAGGDAQALTDTPDVTEWWPSISPDGTQLAYVANSESDPQVYDIYTMDINGANVKRVTDLGMKIFCVEWSPDATKFALCARPADESEEDEIYTINIDGTELTNLTNTPERDYDPDWSPDGKYIAFDSDRELSALNIGYIYVMQADGSDVRRLANGYSADWSPDGTKFAYTGSCSVAGRQIGTLCMMNADGSESKAVPSSIGRDVGAHWSPDGNYLVVSSRTTIDSEDADTEIFVLAIDGIERIRLTDNDAEEPLVTWGVAP